MSENRRRRYAAEIQAQVTALEELLPEIKRRLNLEDKEWLEAFMRDTHELFEAILAVKPSDPPHASHFILADLRATCTRLNQPWSFMKSLESKRKEVRNLTEQINNDPSGNSHGDMVSHLMGE